MLVTTTREVIAVPFVVNELVFNTNTIFDISQDYVKIIIFSKF